VTAPPLLLLPLLELLELLELELLLLELELLLLLLVLSPPPPPQAARITLVHIANTSARTEARLSCRGRIEFMC
jgi:hypothetical protein